LLDALKGPHAAAALQFVIGHELGHLKGRHQVENSLSPAAVEAVTQNEVAADLHGLQHMQAQGFDLVKIRAAKEVVMTALARKLADYPALMVLTRLRDAALDEAISTAEDAQASDARERSELRESLAAR